MDICRIGLIGAGNVGRRHAQVLRSFPDVHLAGITDVVPEAAAALARDVGCRPFAGTGELLSAGLDAVLRLRAAVRARGARGRCPVRGGAALCGEAAGRDGGDGRASGRPGRRGGRTDRRRSPLALPEGGRTCPAVARRAGGAPGRRDVAGQGAPRRVVAGPGPVRRTGDRAGRARPGPGPALGRRGGRGVRDGRRAAPRGARRRRRRRDHRHPAVSQRCARNAEHHVPARLEAAGRPGAGRRGAVAIGG